MITTVTAALINRWNVYRGTKYVALNPAWTVRQAITYMFTLFDANFSVDGTDIAEPA